MRARSHRANGFTLLEVLVSTVLLSSVFVAVVALTSQSLRNVNRMQPHTLALNHAREKMNELLLAEQLAPGAYSGSWNDGYRWEVQVSSNSYSTQSDANAYGLFDIRVAIYWGELASEKSYILETTQWAKKVPTNANR